MPYSLKGNSVVKSDSGEVVKTHPTREKALAHLKALKANVEEGSPAVLGALLEAFDAAKHPRDFHGRWRKGDKVHVVTPQGHVDRGVVEKPAESYDAITSRGSERSTTVQVRWEDGDVTHERPGDIQAGHKYGSIKQAARAGALPSQRPEGQGAVRPTGQKFDSIGAAARAGQLPSQQRRSDPSVTHAGMTRQLENLPEGRYHSLPGLGNGGSLARKTKAGIEVYRALKATPEKVHKTPSAAAAHMMRIRNEGVVRVRESAPEVLGVLLEAFDEGKHRRGFHGRFIGSWDPGKFGDEGLSTRVGGLKAGKTLKFKGSDVKVLAHANHYEVYHPVLKHWSGASSASEASNKAINFHRQATQKVRELASAPEVLGALLEGR